MLAGGASARLDQWRIDKQDESCSVIVSGEEESAVLLLRRAFTDSGTGYLPDFKLERLMGLQPVPTRHQGGDLVFNFAMKSAS